MSEKDEKKESNKVKPLEVKPSGEKERTRFVYLGKAEKKLSKKKKSGK